jgi:hypothetical protein
MYPRLEPQILWTMLWFHKRRRISWLAEWLSAPGDEFFSVDLISWKKNKCRDVLDRFYPRKHFLFDDDLHLYKEF